MNRSLMYVTLCASLVLTSMTARAGVTIDLTEANSTVFATATGTLDVTDLTFLGTTSRREGAGVAPFQGAVNMGPLSFPSMDVYTGITGPTQFGGLASFFADFGTGDPFGVIGEAEELVLPHGYASGTGLSATDEYFFASFSSLELTPGTYTWTWGTGAHADFLTVQIGPVTAVPEPSTAMVAVFGAMGGVAYGWSRHRRRTAA